MIPIPFQESAGPQLFCTKPLSKTSPGSQTGGRPNVLTISAIKVLPAVLMTTSAVSNLIIISRLYHFACAPALSFPVLRLNLMLPLRFQGLGTGGWLGLTRWGFPTQFRQLTNATENSFRLQAEIGVADFAARTFCTIYHISALLYRCRRAVFTKTSSSPNSDTLRAAEML